MVFHICEVSVSTTINQRFAQLIQYLGITKNAFAMSLDKTASVIQHLLDGRNKPGFDLLYRVFEVYPNVSRDWVMLGQGPMLLTGEVAPAPAPAPVPQVAVAAEIPAAPEPTKPEPAPTPALPIPAAVKPEIPAAPSPAAAPASAPNPDIYVTAALHTQHLQHQLALAEMRNQHLLEQQKLLREMLDMTRR